MKNREIRKSSSLSLMSFRSVFLHVVERWFIQERKYEDKCFEVLLKSEIIIDRIDDWK